MFRLKEGYEEDVCQAVPEELRPPEAGYEAQWADNRLGPLSKA
jgi:hypothetical protein